MVLTCSVKTCENKPKKWSPIMFHKIPMRNPERLQLWLIALNMDPNTPVEVLKKCSICSDHFQREDYYEKMEFPSQKMRLFLTDKAIPKVDIKPKEQTGTVMLPVATPLKSSCLNDQGNMASIDYEIPEASEDDVSDNEIRYYDDEDEEGEGEDGKTADSSEWEPDEVDSSESDANSDSNEESDEESDENAPSTVEKTLCPDCGKFFVKIPHVCELKVKHHLCLFCGKRCLTKRSLKSHSRIHDDGHIHPCKFCLQPFRTRSDKLAHEQIHRNEEKPYQCPDCSDCFRHIKLRNTHLSGHRGLWRHVCKICNLKFPKLESLQRHALVHTGEKPFVCEVCQRTFRQTSHLKSHMRVHTGEKPFKCQQCEKSFNHNVSLKSHVKQHHDDPSCVPKEHGENQESNIKTHSKSFKVKRRRRTSDLDLGREEEEGDPWRPIGRPKVKL